MINGKFFSGLTEGMMRKSNPGVDRQRTNFFWPEEELPDNTNSSPRKTANSTTKPNITNNNNEDTCKSRYKQQLTSKINFYDDTVDTPGDNKRVPNNRNNNDKNKSQNDFYGYEGNYNNNNVQDDGNGKNYNNNNNIANKNKNDDNKIKANGKVDEDMSRRDKGIPINGESNNNNNNKNTNNKYPVMSKSNENLASNKIDMQNNLNSINGKLNDMKITKNNSNNNNNYNNKNVEQKTRVTDNNQQITSKTTSRSSHTSSVNTKQQQQQQQSRKNINNGIKPKNNDNDDEFYKSGENYQQQQQQYPASQNRRIPIVVEDTNNSNFMTATNNQNRIIKSGRRSNYEELDPKEAYRKNRNERQSTQMGCTMYGYQTPEDNRINDDIARSTSARNYDNDYNPTQPTTNRGLTRSLTIHGPADTIPNEARQRAQSHLKSSIFFNDDASTACDRRPASVRPPRGSGLADL